MHDDASKGLLRAAMQQLHLSARGYHRVLKLARMIADLTGAETIEIPHLAEAIQCGTRRHVWVNQDSWEAALSVLYPLCRS